MTILTVENLTDSDLVIPGLGVMIPANSAVDVDWDQDAIDIFREYHDVIEPLWDAGSMNLKINGMQLPEFHCIMITDCANVWNPTTKEYLEGVNAPDYMDGNWMLNPTPVEDVDPRYWVLDGVEIRAMTTEEIDIQEAPNMLEHRLAKISVIHDQTVALNSQGFMYGGCHFSLNEVAQMNWDAILTAENSGLLTYPTSISQSNGTNYDITGATDLRTFAGIGLGIIFHNYSTERVLISQAWSAPTKSALDAIEDNR